MTSEELKQFCKERNLTYKELAELIGFGEGAVKNA
ncbi:transcriptional regulator, partial [Campylobacter coli]|nr:transcriptional regulator [Campylobacter coli]